MSSSSQTQNPSNEPIYRPDDADVTGINELVSKISGYRQSAEYFELMQFMTRFRHYAPHNCFLLHMQNPRIGHVATANDWLHRFHRSVKPGAHALVILKPWGPVQFVYDLSDTVGDDAKLPNDLFHPFKSRGLLSSDMYARTVEACRKDRIRVIDISCSLLQAGCARRLEQPEPSQIRNLPPIHYEIEVNTELDLATRYTTLIHEVGHIYAGHLGTSFGSWWKDRSKLDTEVEEFEAESIAYLVSQRLGLDSQSEKYLANYVYENERIPNIDFKVILDAVSTIEKIGKKKSQCNDDAMGDKQLSFF